MADKKISALTGATTPLAGTEVLPIVQSGATVKVSVANLTAGRAISATAITASTDNFVVGTSTKGLTTSGANALRLGTNGSTSQASLTSNSNITLGSTDLPYQYVDTSNAKGVANLNAGLGKCLAGGVSPVTASTGTADFNVGFFAMGFLLVNNEVLADGAQYTSKTYSLFTRGGGAFTATEIATANGTSGGATFTVTWVGDSTIRVTNTQGNTTSVRFAYFGL